MRENIFELKIANLYIAATLFNFYLLLFMFLRPLDDT